MAFRQFISMYVCVVKVSPSARCDELTKALCGLSYVCMQLCVCLGLLVLGLIKVGFGFFVPRSP